MRIPWASGYKSNDSAFANFSRYLKLGLQARRVKRNPNLVGAVAFPPGHFYSPLLDVESIQPGTPGIEFDGADYWENLDLRCQEQKSFYERLLKESGVAQFPVNKEPGCFYYSENEWFDLADAFLLAGILKTEKPRRIIEVGSGFSSAAMLDTMEKEGLKCRTTFIEPNPERLDLLLQESKDCGATIIRKRVQEVPLAVFDELEEHDVLFIDSSHVAKVGSDLTFIILRVLPRLKPGVLVHFHDIFFPFSYPCDWIKTGRAWNESIFLRAFLLQNKSYEIKAFNSYAAHSFPEIFAEKFPEFPKNPGGSFWIRRTAE